MLWDLDGTLVDSRDQHWRAWRETLAAEGVAITEAQFLATFGRRNADLIGDWLGDTAPERMRRVDAAKELRFRELVATEGIDPLPGAAEWIRRLAAGRWRQAVASSAPRANVSVMLEAVGLTGPLATVVAAEDVRRGKPEPDVFLIAADRIGAEPSRCVVVEDAPAGVDAARRAGMSVIGVGARGLDAADVAVDSLADLPADAFERLVKEA
ncbi:MAG: HAD family phosphatase [Gemmatimonadota bacterium]